MQLKTILAALLSISLHYLNAHQQVWPAVLVRERSAQLIMYLLDTCMLQILYIYRILWLISTCAYSGKRNDSMHIWHITTPTNVWARDGCEPSASTSVRSIKSFNVYSCRSRWRVLAIYLKLNLPALFVAIISPKISGLHIFQVHRTPRLSSACS